MWELDHKESWVPKNWCFWILVLERRFLRVPWTARRSNQSILKEISFECSLEGLVLKLKLQSFGHLMWWTDSLEKTLMLERIEGRRSGQQRMRWLDGISDNGNEFEETLGDSEGQGILVCCSPWGCRVRHNQVAEQQWQQLLPVPGGTSSKEPACQCRRHKRQGFDPWVRKIPWRKEWQPTPVFLPGESHGQKSLAGYSS